MAESAQKIFAIGDVHGCANELQRLLDNLPLESDSTIVFLGDYINRGSQSREVIDIVLDLAESYHVVALMGNHEAMFLDFLNDRSSQGAGLFVYNGGGTTLASYGVDDPDAELVLPESHRQFLENLPISYMTDDYFFVHAGVPDEPIDSLTTEKHKKTMLWIRDKFHLSTYNWGRRIIHGHTPVEDVDVKFNRINIDTACAYDNKLSAIELPAMRVYSVKRKGKYKPMHFTTPNSRRKSARFHGSLRVYVRTKNGVIEFHTGDYSETGMNLHSRKKSQKPLLRVHESIMGYVSSKRHDMIRFTGEVVRIWQQGDDVCYGVQLDSAEQTATIPPTVKEPALS